MYRKILVPVDGSDASTAGLREAIKLAKSQACQIQLVHIVNEFIPDYGYAGAYAGEFMDSLRKAGKNILDSAEALVQREGVKPECVLLEAVGGQAAEMILEQAKAWMPDLIIMGTHGRRGLVRMVMGSDAEAVVRGATVPVMLVRAAPKQQAMPRRAAKASAA